MAKKSQDTSGDDGTSSRLVNTGLRATMLERLPKKELGHGDFLYKIGDRVDGFFIVQAGTLEVLREGEVVRTLTVGDLVGERQYFEESDMRLQCTKPRNETVRAESDTVVSHLTADQLNMVILNSQEAGIKLIHHYARLAIQAEDRAAVNQHANKDLAKTAAQAEKEAADASQKLTKAKAEISQLKERNDGQAASLARLNDENVRLEQVVRDHEAELAGLRTDLSAANRTLVETEQLRQRLMQEQHQRAEAAEADLAKAKETLVETSVRARGLAEELVGAKMDAEDALRQLGDEQRAKIAAERRAQDLQETLDRSQQEAIEWQTAQRAQAEMNRQIDEENLARMKQIQDDNTRLRGQRDELAARQSNPIVRNSGTDVIDLTKLRVELEKRRQGVKIPALPPPSLEATSRDLPAQSADPPSDTQRNRPIFGNAPQYAGEESPALELDLSTMPGVQAPTSPRHEGRNARKETMVLDPNDPDVQIEVDVASTPPPKPQ